MKKCCLKQRQDFAKEILDILDECTNNTRDIPMFKDALIQVVIPYVKEFVKEILGEP